MSDMVLSRSSSGNRAVMSADFWAGYISGATGILIGNPLDLVKVRLQAGESAAASAPPLSLSHQGRVGPLIRGLSL